VRERSTIWCSTFGIPRERIFGSRDDGFLEGVMMSTNGEGVDLVLESLAGELLHAGWKSVARGWKMLELGKRDMSGSAKFGYESVPRQPVDFF
jgi:NADPH:quinone reductase-like Zn-dependent oxidoreductase